MEYLRSKQDDNNNIDYGYIVSYYYYTYMYIGICKVLFQITAKGRCFYCMYTDTLCNFNCVVPLLEQNNVNLGSFEVTLRIYVPTEGNFMLF